MTLTHLCCQHVKTQFQLISYLKQPNKKKINRRSLKKNNYKIIYRGHIEKYSKNNYFCIHSNRCCFNDKTLPIKNGRVPKYVINENGPENYTQTNLYGRWERNSVMIVNWFESEVILSGIFSEKVIVTAC